MKFQWSYTTYFLSGVAHRLEVFSRWRRTRITNAFSYESFINFRQSVHLRVELARVLTIKIFRKIMFDFKRIIHQKKPIRDPRNVTWFDFSFQKYMIYPGPDGGAKYGKAEETL